MWLDGLRNVSYEPRIYGQRDARTGGKEFLEPVLAAYSMTGLKKKHDSTSLGGPRLRYCTMSRLSSCIGLKDPVVEKNSIE